jgi:hypothetical protein
MRRARSLLSLALPPAALAFVLVADGGDHGPPVRSPFEKAAPLYAPKPTSGFRFAIVGDRTHGPESGLQILRRAVREMNSLDPDFVMTVGDLVSGYNRGDEWLAQMRRYKEVMAGLKMPWYPVAGNHDVYPETSRPNDRGNERRYLENFGPLWYSFDHEFAHFVVLYSDEQLSFKNPPVDQRMSEEQLKWLADDLAATDRKQAFVFLHHPRWNYAGDVWKPVHEVLAQSGKVRAVFAGHWHRYRSDGTKDGIHYYVMAATGAAVGRLDQAGDLQHWNFVSVRPDGFTMAVVPVGSLLESDFVTSQESDDCIALLGGAWLGPAPRLDPNGDGGSAQAANGEGSRAAPEGGGRSDFTVRVANPTTKPIDVELDWSANRGGLSVEPAKSEVTLGPKEEATPRFTLVSGPAAPGFPRIAPALTAAATYRLHGEEGRAQRVEQVLAPELAPLPLPADFAEEPVATPERMAAGRLALALDGKSACAIVPFAPELDPDGPFTLECWTFVDPLARRSGLVNCTENSGYGFFVDRDDATPPHLTPSCSLFVAGEGYANAIGAAGDLPARAWIHVAATWDGSDLRLYVGGRLVAAARHPGRLRGNKLPLVVGGDVDGNGRATSLAAGAIDEVRLSKGVRYSGESFTPARRFTADGETLLLLHFDRISGDLTPDSSGHGHHARLAGAAYLRPVIEVK